MYDLDGRQRGSTYGKGYDLETALQMAKADAEDEAARYIGDWHVVVEQKPGSPGAVKTKRAAKAKVMKRTSPWGAVGTSSDVLPWQGSYANWTVRVGEAAVKYNAPIAFGPGTYEAWQAGISPDEYARARRRRA